MHLKTVSTLGGICSIKVAVDFNAVDWLSGGRLKLCIVHPVINPTNF